MKYSYVIAFQIIQISHEMNWVIKSFFIEGKKITVLQKMPSDSLAVFCYQSQVSLSVFVPPSGRISGMRMKSGSLTLTADKLLFRSRNQSFKRALQLW